jgi:hypothetical protein
MTRILVTGPQCVKYVLEYKCLTYALLCGYTLFFFNGFDRQGLATADLVHGNREISLNFVVDRMLVLAKQGRFLRSGIILIVAIPGDGGESRFCGETITCRKGAVLDNFYPTYFR